MVKNLEKKAALLFYMKKRGGGVRISRISFHTLCQMGKKGRSSLSAITRKSCAYPFVERGEGRNWPLPFGHAREKKTSSTVPHSIRGKKGGRERGGIGPVSE